MKGIIFTSFVEFAEQQLGEDFVEEMLETLPLSTGGAYTNVGTYPTDELLNMVSFILERHEIDAAAMLQSFGEFTFAVLVDSYGSLVEGFKDSFDCIYNVDQTIHKSVRKLYPDAELPDMNARLSKSGQRLTLEYQSARPFMQLAHGLIMGCVNHYGDAVDVSMTDLSDGAGTHAEFVLKRHV